MANGKFVLYHHDRPFVALQGNDGYERDPNHKYLIYGEKPPVGFISQAAEILTRSYFKGILDQPLKKWKKDKKSYNITITDNNTGEKRISKPLSYLIFAGELRTHGAFDNSKFNVAPIGCPWLDTSLDISQNFHFLVRMEITHCS